VPPFSVRLAWYPTVGAAVGITRQGGTMDMPTRHRRKPSGPSGRPMVVFLSTAALTAAAAGCGASGPAAGGAGASSSRSGSPMQIVLASVDKTEAADTATVDLTISVSGTPSIGGLVPSASSGSSSAISLAIGAQGAFDFTNKTGQMTMTLPAIGASPASTLQMRQIGSTLYVSAPQLSSLDGGKPWVQVNTNDYLQKVGQSAGPLGGFSDGDPTQVLSMLDHLSAGVTNLGPALVGGIETTRFRGTIDLTGTSSSPGSTVISSQMASALGLTSLPIDVWIDGQGRARQVQTSFSLFGLTVGAKVDLGGFGTPVSVAVPGADSTADGSSLLDSGQLGNLFGLGGS